MVHNDPLHQVLQSLELIAVSLDREGRIQFCNDHFLKLTGWSREEITGENWFETCLPDKDRDRIFHTVFLKTMQTGEYPAQYRNEIVTRNGQRRLIKWHNTSIHNEDGRIEMATSIGEDITDREKIERELRFQATLLNQITDRITAVGLDGKILSVNDAVLTSLGRTREELIGKSISVYPYNTEKGPSQRDILEKTIEHGEWHGEIVNDLSDGREIILDCRTTMVRDKQGQPSYIAGIATDITDQKRAQEQLTALNRAFLEAERIGKIGYWTWDPQDKTGFWSDGLYHIYGRDPTQGVPNMEEMLNYLPYDDRERVSSAIKKSLDTGSYRCDFHIIRPSDGCLLSVRARGEVDYDDQGQPSQHIGVIIDVTELVQAEQEQLRLKAQYAQAQKLESVGRLAGGIAHDLNNLLAPILGYCELLLEDTQDHHPNKPLMTDIQNAGLRARDLTQQLLAFSRKQTLQVKNLDLNDLIRNFLRLLRHSLREDIKVRLSLSPDPTLVRGDAGQLEQVVMNLAINAQDAMPNGGDLTIQTRIFDVDERATRDIGPMKSGRYVLLTMVDTGIGMDEDTLANIYEPFFTTKCEGEGTGLGLSTVYGIVKQHSGYLWAESEPGRGSSFSVYLPQVESISTEVRRSEPEVHHAKGTETVLLVEDSEQVREMVFAILRRHGYKVIAANEGKHALEILGTYHDPVHLLLTDVVMPDMNGHDLALSLERSHPHIKVLYMSGYTNNMIARHGILPEGTNYLQKPFSVRDLTSKVRRVLDEPSVSDS